MPQCPPEPGQCQSRRPIELWRGASLRPAAPRLRLGTWNVEGLSCGKLHQLQAAMQRRGLAVLCVQETHLAGASTYISDEGFLVILSGSRAATAERSGVGFLVALWARHFVIGFVLHSARLATLKLRTVGGKMAIVNAYAPHNGKPRDERVEFFTTLHRYTPRPPPTV